MKLPKWHFIINFINKDNFTQEFKESYFSLIEKKELLILLKNKEKEIKEVFSKISIFDLISENSNIKKKLKENEQIIKEYFKINTFVDYSSLNKDKFFIEIKNIINNDFISDKELKKFTELVIKTSKLYKEILTEMGIIF